MRGKKILKNLSLKVSKLKSGSNNQKTNDAREFFIKFFNEIDFASGQPEYFSDLMRQCLAFLRVLDSHNKKEDQRFVGFFKQKVTEVFTQANIFELTSQANEELNQKFPPKKIEENFPENIKLSKYFTSTKDPQKGLFYIEVRIDALRTNIIKRMKFFNQILLNNKTQQFIEDSSIYRLECCTR